MVSVEESSVARKRVWTYEDDALEHSRQVLAQRHLDLEDVHRVRLAVRGDAERMPRHHVRYRMCGFTPLKLACSPLALMLCVQAGSTVNLLGLRAYVSSSRPFLGVHTAFPYTNIAYRWSLAN